MHKSLIEFNENLHTQLSDVCVSDLSEWVQTVHVWVSGWVSGWVGVGVCVCVHVCEY